MAIVVGIDNGRGLGIDTRHGNYNPIRVGYLCIRHYFTVQSFNAAVLE